MHLLICNKIITNLCYKRKKRKEKYSCILEKKKKSHEKFIYFLMNCENIPTLIFLTKECEIY